MVGDDAILAIDLGTSSLKAVLISRDGMLIDLAKREYPTRHPHTGWSEQDPDHWWQAAIDAIRQLRATSSGVAVAAIGVTGQMHGIVTLDATGDAVGPAIIWSDRRSVQERDAIADEVGDTLAHRIGGPLGVGYQATTMRWLRDSEPERASRITSVLLPKDALAFRLTGVRATEPSDAISTGLLNSGTWEWDTTMLAASGVDPSWLPAIVASGSISGSLLPEIASLLGLSAGIPVILAGGDAPCAAFGAHVTHPDEAMVVLSSGAQVIVPTAGFAPDPGARWHTFPSAVGDTGTGERRNRVGATSNAGIALEWISALTGTPVTTLLDEAAAVVPGAEGCLFIPSLTGQRTPVVDPLARGSFFGLSDRHGRAELGRALAEGIVLACRHVYVTILGEESGPTHLRLGGGPSQHPLIRQIVADVFNLPVHPLESPDLTAIGAARSAALAIGWADFEVREDPASIVRPDPANAAFYDELFAIHVAAAESSRALSHRLQAISPAGRKDGSAS